MRAFLAIELPDVVRASLGQAIVRLRKSIPNRASWVREENLHITVRFLGEVEESMIERFAEQVSASAGQECPVPLRIAGLGVYPNPKRARVLWCGGEGDVERLLHFQKQCEMAAQAFGFQPESRSWTPHVTLARFREPPLPSALQNALETFSAYQAGEFSVPGVTLFSSQLTPQGAQYTPIRKFLFSCPST